MDIVARNRKLWEWVKKGDLSVSDLITDGGQLPAEFEPVFMEKVYESTPFLNKIRKVEMSEPKRKIYKLGIAEEFLHAAPASGTALDASKRAKVFTQYVEMTTTELIGSMYIPYDVVEDNIARGALEDVLMNNIIPKKAARSLEKVCLQGDADSVDSLLTAFDGYLKLLNASWVNGTSKGGNKIIFNQLTGQVTDDLWADIIETMPYAYRENETALEFFTHQSLVDAWRRKIRQRLTQQGDAVINIGQLAQFSSEGIPINRASNMPAGSAILANPLNFILGAQRGITVETNRDIEARMIIIVMTMRVALGIEEAEACVVASNVNPSGTTTVTTG